MNLEPLHRLLRQHPAYWPPLPRYLLCLAAFSLPLLSGWQLYLAPTIAALARATQEEAQLKTDYQRKLQQTAMLAQLQVAQATLRQRIEQHAQQFSDDEDTSAWLGEIAAIADRHLLTLEQAKPVPAMHTAHYLILPLQLRLLGRYHDIGRFSATLAAVSKTRILRDLQLSSNASESELLRLETRVLSYRRLPPERTP